MEAGARVPSTLAAEPRAKMIAGWRDAVARTLSGYGRLGGRAVVELAEPTEALAAAIFARCASIFPDARAIMPSCAAAYSIACVICCALSASPGSSGMNGVLKKF